jgi:hypothetical protein
VKWKRFVEFEYPAQSPVNRGWLCQPGKKRAVSGICEADAFTDGDIGCAQLNCETKFWEKWLTHFGFGG